MSTTRIRTFSQSPYWDDFDETKNYHRILFRPGYAVQARELTQMQTALQAQIDRHGQYAFKDGSRVVNGEVSLDIGYEYIKLESSFQSDSVDYNADNYLSEFVGTTVTGTSNSGNQVSAIVIGYSEYTDANNPNTIYVKYQGSGGTDKSVERFAAGEVIVTDGEPIRYGMVGGGINVDGANTASAINTPIGVGSAIHVREGVYFISGCFVYVPAETLILDKYTNTPSYIVGFKVVDDVVIDSGTDVSLVDNAQGVPNTSAPGANRYQISTTLIKENISLASRTVDSYIPLLTVTNGITTVDTTEDFDDTELTARFARRTKEESGDYSLNPYEIEITEHLNDTTNFGKYLVSEGGDADKLSLGIEPGVSYVQGFRNENVGTKYISINKPRGLDATAYANSVTTQIRVGNYVKLSKTGLKGAPDLSTFTTLQLRNSSSAQIGTARARGIETYSDHVRLYLFDITMTTGTFNSVAKVYQAGSPQAFVGDLSVVGSRFDTGQNGVVFKLPYNAIKTLTNPVLDNIYKVRQTFNTSTSAGTFSISIGAGQGTFSDVTDIIISAGTADSITTGITGNITSGGNGSTSLVFNSSALGIADGTTVKVIATVQKTLQQKAKTRQSNVTVNINVTDGNALSYDLDKSDIIRIVDIRDSNNDSVKDRFTLDNGQRDNFYDEGKIVKIGGSSAVRTGTMVVTLDHYSHGAGDYFTVDSYPTSDYSTIGSFASVQGSLELRDCIDFRPVKASSGSITLGSEFSSGVGSSLSAPPKPGHALLTDVTYYLPRIDNLYLTRDGDFGITEGVPGDHPSAPEDRQDSMTLYRLELPPYVFSPSEIKPVIIDNKRYTMRDIGNIDKRVKNLEYYTSLSLLEQSAADTHMVDGSGFSRFKNGFLVDSFKGHNVGDVVSTDYKCSIDKRKGILRPKFDERNVNLVRQAGDSGSAVKNDSVVTMPFTETNHINQPYSSFFINVNPYNIFSWGGSVKLSPDSDEWKEVDVRPNVTIDDDGMYDQMIASAEEEGILGTVWSEWETNWTGVSQSSTAGQWQRERFAEDRRGFGGGNVFARASRTVTTTTTTTGTQSRSGLVTDVVTDTVKKNMGSKVIEVNFVPFMRSRKIYFRAELLKPDTKLYAFFNDINVTAYCNQESFQIWSDTSNITEYPDVTSHPSGGGTLVTNSFGEISGSFVIPRNSSIKFKTGIKEFKLSDSSTNNTSLEVTYASTQFTAAGVIESVQSTIISTKVAKFVTSEISESNNISQSSTRTTTEWEDPLAETILITTPGGIFATSCDIFFKSKAVKTNIPVSISIRTVENGTPTQKLVPGTEVNLKPSSVNTSADASTSTRFTFEYPVYLQQDQEYAIVIKSNCDEYEVYVAEMGGYDLTNASYRITKQPFGGSFFTSQNASTWTPEQSKDLKFNLNRAQFTTASPSEITLVNDVLPLKKLINNPLSTVNGSANIRVSHKNHGMHLNGSKVTISGAVTTNGITSAQINGTHDISSIEHDSYVISTAGTATSTGTGGGSVIYATNNRHYDTLYAILSNLQVPGTSIRFYATTYSQQSIDGSEAAYQVQNEFEILPNATVEFGSPKVIGSAAVEAGNIGGAKSFKIRAVLTSTSDKLSPVIDMDRLSLITIQNIIGDAGNNNASYSNYVAETSSTGGSELAKYITRRVDLSEEADVIDVYIAANRPSGSNIDLYYKTVGGGSDTDFNSVDWILAPSTEAIVINDGGSFEEVKYSIDPPGSFGSMAFKIVLRSISSSAVPTVRDFRAIAAT